MGHAFTPQQACGASSYSAGRAVAGAPLVELERTGASLEQQAKKRRCTGRLALAAVLALDTGSNIVVACSSWTLQPPLSSSSPGDGGLNRVPFSGLKEPDVLVRILNCSTFAI
ncbi:hypothetical protein [Oryza sativa Japonica Group]|uniref:Uncharacterized protein n=1 Tax=Oryza sativa subsp. japonica TaxID=39947 RepID=Q5JLI6_ORYSJ|nr:hypothetical protein [Oryza sativa Japonica Group]